MDVNQTGDKSYFIHCFCPWHVLLWNQAGTEVLQGSPGVWPFKGCSWIPAPLLTPKVHCKCSFKVIYFSMVWLHYLPVSFSSQSNFCFVLSGMVQEALICMGRFPWSGAQYLPACVTNAVCEGNSSPCFGTFVNIYNQAGWVHSAAQRQQKAALGAAMSVLL